MNKLGTLLLAASLAASAPLEGCLNSGPSHCDMRGGEVSGILNSSAAEKICNQNRQRILKCIKIGSGMNDGPEIVNINCSTEDSSNQISDAYNSDMTTCNASTKNDIQVNCN